MIRSRYFLKIWGVLSVLNQIGKQENCYVHIIHQIYISYILYEISFTNN